MDREQAKAFLSQFETSRINIRQAKRDMPWLFTEWAQLKAAEEGLEQAKEKLRAAQDQWNKPGA